MHRSFEASATQNTSVRYMMVQTDQNVSTSRLSTRLGVEATPTYIFYHKGHEVDRLLGANIIKFEKALASLLAINNEPATQVSTPLSDSGGGSAEGSRESVTESVSSVVRGSM
eukprot:3752761-Pyramimonas_sp.AAC.2